MLVLAGLGTISSEAQSCVAPPVGLVWSWSGEGNTLDARGRNNGTLQNGATYGPGYIGQAFQLSGNNSTRVLLGNPKPLQQDFTIEAWVKRASAVTATNSPNGGSTDGLIFSYGQGGYALYIKGTTGKLAIGQVGVSETIATNLAVTDTNWHHVAVTQKGPPFTGGTQAIFYLDGVADIPNGYAPPFFFTTNAAIGSRGDGFGLNAFLGSIDEMAIYDRALSPADIASIYNAGTSGKCKPMATDAPDNQVLWLAGDGDVNDKTGNGNDGTLQNGAGYTVGKVGQSFSFDGVDDQVTIPDNASQNGGTNLTIEAWINPTNLPHGATILQKRTSGNIGGYLLEPTQPSGSGAPNGLAFIIMIGGVYSTLNPANVVVPNVWQHVAATYDGSFMRIYVNGVEVANKPQSGAIDNVAAPVMIGRNIVNPSAAFLGKIDEISVYNRALSATEIESIANAGLGGKYKVQATAPANIVAWYPGDSSTNDLVAANNGTLQGGATYALGKVGQAFSLNGTNAYVSAPSTAANDPTGAANGASMEAWVYLNQLPSAAGHPFYIVSKTSVNASEGFDIHIDADNYFKFVWSGSYTGFANFQVQIGTWYHVVATFDQNAGNSTAGVRFYVNGVFQGTGNAFTPRTASNQPLDIGHSSALGGNRFFNGLIDEPAIYNRTLTPDEIRDQYYAGAGGKYKGSSNPVVLNRATVGDTGLTFNGLTAGGAVHQVPVDLSLLPPLPGGATSVGLTYDISTSAVSAGPTLLCFKLPGLSQTQFSDLAALHLESGVWVDRATAKNSVNRTICASSPTLSPFAFARVLNPTAATVSVSGRVSTAGGLGITNAVMTLLDSQGRTLTARTSGLGYYRFDDLPVGQSYVLSISSKRYVFTPSSRLVSLDSEVTDADFTADQPTSNRKNQ